MTTGQHPRRRETDEQAESRARGIAERNENAGYELDEHGRPRLVGEGAVRAIGGILDFLTGGKRA